MKRRERMLWYIARINTLLCNLPTTKCNEIQCKALWENVMLSHPDIADKINGNKLEAKNV